MSDIHPLYMFTAVGFGGAEGWRVLGGKMCEIIITIIRRIAAHSTQHGTARRTTTQQLYSLYGVLM